VLVCEIMTSSIIICRYFFLEKRLFSRTCAAVVYSAEKNIPRKTRVGGRVFPHTRASHPAECAYVYITKNEYKGRLLCMAQCAQCVCMCVYVCVLILTDAVCIVCYSVWISIVWQKCYFRNKIKSNVYH